MARRRRKGRPGKARRNLIVFALLIAGLAGLIVCVGTMNRAPRCIMPPESPEVTEKRQSPHNAYAVLMMPLPDLPGPPEPLMVPLPSNPKVSDRYEPRTHSVGDLVGVIAKSGDME